MSEEQMIMIANMQRDKTLDEVREFLDSCGFQKNEDGSFYIGDGICFDKHGIFVLNVKLLNMTVEKVKKIMDVLC